MRSIKKTLSIILALAMTLSMFTSLSYAATTYTMTVDESTVVKVADDSMYGLNMDWAIAGIEKYVSDAENDDYSPTTEIKSLFSRSEIPVIRLGEAASQQVLWKDMIGEYDERPERTLWGTTGAIKFGLVEKIKYFQELNPEVEFIITLNMNDTAENLADLAEFLTGDASSEWGAKRIAYGIENPVPVKMYQLGNENDHAEPVMTSNDYVAKSSDIIEAISAVDSNAVFGAIGGTNVYTHYIRDSKFEDEWLKAIVEGLNNDIDYVTFNWYYDMNSTYEIDTLVDLVKNTIFDETGENRIKICFTETAGAVYGEPATVPYNLQGVLASADFYIRSYQNTEVTSANYHAINSSSWKYIWFNDEGKSGLTGIGMLHTLLKDYGCGNVISSNLTGYRRGNASDVAGVAISPEKDKINLIFVNHKNEAVTVNLGLDNGYKMYKELILNSTSGTPALTDVTNGESNRIDMYTYNYADGKSVNEYTLPAYSVTAVSFEKRASSETVVYSDDFTDSTTMNSYTAVLADDAESYGIAATIENGTLNLDGYGDDGTTYEDNYVYLPESVSNLDNYTVSAKVSVSDYDDGYFGVVFNSSEKNNVLTEGNGYVALISADGVSEQKYVSGSATNVVTETTTNAPTLEADAEFDVKLTVSNGNISFYVDNNQVYTHSCDEQSLAGNIGFLFSDISVQLDDVVVTSAKETVSLNKPFVYEENFDNVEDGTLPDNFEITSGVANAYVKDGALIVDNQQWYKREGVILSNLSNVAVEGLTIEADMTVVNTNESARAGKVPNHGGFMYGIEGSNRTTSGLQTFASYLQFRDKAGELVMNQGVSYSESEIAFNNGGTVSVKMICSEGKTPTVYINGKEVSYTKGTASSIEKGYIGLFAQASGVKFDNLKISGEQVYEFDKDEIETKTLDFSYEEDFNSMSNGTLPEGWTVVNEDGRAEYATAEVRDGAFYLYSRAQYGKSTYVLFDYENVLRNGLTLECDITRKAVSSGNTNNSRAGLMYAVDYDEATATLKNGSYVAPYIAKTESSSAIGLRDFRTISETESLATVSSTVGYTDKDGNALQFNWATREKPVHLKIALNNETQSPVIYVDGVQVKYSRMYNSSADRVLSGRIGLYAFNATVAIDNIVVSGKRNVTVPTNSTTYEAKFNTTSTVFADIQDAESSIVLNEVDFLGNTKDITANATFETSLVEDNKYVTVVSYDKDGDSINDFTTELSWTCQFTDDGFRYEENFDTLANGTLPEGWTVVNEDGRAEYATAEVRDGAFYLYSRAQYGKSTYVLFDYEKVLRPGMTMECDITRKAVSSGNTNNSRAGLMYAVDYDEATATLKNGSYVAPYIAKAESSSAIGLRDFRTISETESLATVSSTVGYTDKDGNALQFNWATREKPVHLKIVLNNETQSPVIYVDGVQIKYDRLFNSSADRVLSGRIGLYAFNATVAIDNIVVSATERNDAVERKNDIKVLNYNYANNKLTVNVRLNKSDLEGKKAFVVLYDKTDRKFVALSELKDWNGKDKDYRTYIEVDGINDFSLDKYDVSVLAWNMNNLTPVSEKADLK